MHEAARKKQIKPGATLLILLFFDMLADKYSIYQ